MTSKWPEPKWLLDVPEHERTAARLRFHLAIAAIYANADMLDQSLSVDLGLALNTVGQIKSRGRITGELAIKLEQLLGRECFPRELFRPDLFLVSAE
jgi:hypothetical protein